MFMSRLLIYKYRFQIVFVVLILFSTFMVLIYTPPTDVRRCFIDYMQESQEIESTTKSTIANTYSPQRLEDILLAETKPVAGKNIFFHETSCPHHTHLNIKKVSLLSHGSLVNFINLSARQACAVESAAKHNPDFNVFVLYTRPVYRSNISNPIIEALSTYSNIYMRNLNMWTYAANTPLYGWLKSEKLFSSRYVLSHISDFLRYLTLWRWGGTYLDMDTITLRSMSNIEPNYVGAESETNLAAGVLNFAPTGFGHDIASKCLQDFEQRFDGNDWGTNGPGVITRVMKTVCGTESIQKMIKNSSCSGFKIYDRNAFYAIPWKEWEHFVEAQYLKSTLSRLNQSFVAHVWNKFSQYRHFKVGSNVAYDKIAQINCPKVYKAAGEYF